MSSEKQQHSDLRIVFRGFIGVHKTRYNSDYYFLCLCSLELIATKSSRRLVFITVGIFCGKYSGGLSTLSA